MSCGDCATPLITSSYLPDPLQKVDPDQWNQLLEELEDWRDSFEATEARYKIAVGEEEVVEFKPSRDAVFSPQSVLPGRARS